MNKKNVSFFFNKEKGIVVATIKYTRDDFVDFVYKEQGEDYPRVYTGILAKYGKKLEMPNHFTGVARLNKDDDAWDEETGKLLAYDRAKKKRDVSFFKRANKFAELMEKENARLYDKIDAYGAKLTHNQQCREKKIEARLGKQ